MQNDKHEVHLSEAERKKLLAVISKGRNRALVIQRAHILLKVDEGKTDAAISEMVYVSEQTIRRIRLRFEQEGMEAALEDRPHPPADTKLDESQEAHLIALACSEPPPGQAKWTLELLTKQLLEDEQGLHISPETVRLLLKKTSSSRGKSEAGASPK